MQVIGQNDEGSCRTISDLLLTSPDDLGVELEAVGVAVDALVADGLGFGLKLGVEDDDDVFPPCDFFFFSFLRRKSRSDEVLEFSSRRPAACRVPTENALACRMEPS